MSGEIRSCPCCGLAQRVPALGRGLRACCPRCEATVARASARRSSTRTAAIALGALLLYPIAVTLPILEVERFGMRRASGILDGIAALFADGELAVALVILVCSVVFPVGKLAALLVLSTPATSRALHARHRALTYRVVEWTGRWGMLDVLLVAVLVAALKLRGVVEVQAGPGALAFAACVALSLLATATFDPHVHWDDET